MLLKIHVIIFRWKWMKVVLLKPSPLMQEKAKEEEEVKVAETQRRLHWWPEQRQGRRRTQNMEAKRGLYPKTDFKGRDEGVWKSWEMANNISYIIVRYSKCWWKSTYNFHVFREELKESGSAQVQSPHARESKEIGGGKCGRDAAQTALRAREAEVRSANKASEELKKHADGQ